MEKIITCTVCPRGCEIQVKGQGGVIESIAGFSCKRGKLFATDEFILPKRIFTSTVKLENGDEPLIPVRSNVRIPKDKLFACMEIIRNTTVMAPICIGDVVVENILGLGCNIVACKNEKAVTGK